MSVPGQVRDGQRRVEPGPGPLQGPAQRRLPGFGDRLLDELLLPAVAEGGEHQPAADEISDPRPVVEADDVQGQVKRGRAAGRGQDVAVVNEQDVRAEVDLRVAAPEVGGELPVHRGRAAVEQPGLGQRVGAGAQADQPGASLVGAPHGLDDGRVRGRVGVGPVWHDDGVRAVDAAQVPGPADGEHRVAHGHPGPGGHDLNR